MTKRKRRPVRRISHINSVFALFRILPLYMCGFAGPWFMYRIASDINISWHIGKYDCAQIDRVPRPSISRLFFSVSYIYMHHFH